MTKVHEVAVLEEIEALPKDQRDLVALVYLRDNKSLRDALALVKGDFR